MAAPIRWLKRHYEQSLLASRRRELEQELTAALDRQIRLVPASLSESYDEIYFALDRSERHAVVRVNSPYRKMPGLAIADRFGIPLPPRQRLDHEWDTYSKLFPHELSPKPLWRTHDAIACSWLNWTRVSRHIVRHRGHFWSVIERVLPTIRAMHDLEVTHLDMNLGNLLLDPHSDRVAVIDFEFGPASWISQDQQKGVDYLRLVSECTRRRRGGKILEADPSRIIRLLDRWVDDATRTADLQFAVSEFAGLRENPSLLAELREVFRNL